MLSRAFVCAEHERSESGSIGIYVGEQELQVPIGEITFLSSVHGATTYVEAWKQTVARWGRKTTDWPTVDVEWTDPTGGEFRVTLQLTDWDGEGYRFQYTVGADTLTPGRWTASR